MTAGDLDARAHAFGGAPVRVHNADGASPVVLVCEHASNHIPPAYGDLGIDAAARASHAAYDPGALPVAEHLSGLFDAPLVAGTVSRLVYDCNRPPEAPSAMPERSERFDIPGNRGLSDSQKAARVETVYRPFERALESLLDARGSGILISVHSFTPVFNGVARAVELGIVHDADARFADAILSSAPAMIDLRAERNAPYGPEDGVTHTLTRHALPRRWRNVMLEIRNDLIAAPADQEWVARQLHALIGLAVEQSQSARQQRSSP